MRDGPVRKNLLPIGITVVMAVGALLIVAAVAIHAFAGPGFGGQVVPLWSAMMIGGSVCMLMGVWLSRRWYKDQRSRPG